MIYLHHIEMNISEVESPSICMDWVTFFVHLICDTIECFMVPYVNRL